MICQEREYAGGACNYGDYYEFVFIEGSLSVWQGEDRCRHFLQNVKRDDWDIENRGQRTEDRG